MSRGNDRAATAESQPMSRCPHSSSMHGSLGNVDRALRCQQCERDVFHKREGLLNTTWVTLLKLDPFNDSAHCLTCESCGHVHWFARRRGAGPSEYLRYEGGMDPQDQ